ncbi:MULTISPECIES: sugar dehydrogenase complex small subunit [Pantoea]|uniref:Dehydrogenase n=1 Tax=Pantoea phytobeneficialis TaxID=2052056 RepID=A0AAP9HB91_9GAMM|nr:MULTISPECIES: sugar dehydrogenase complex small subunit [Pantoea]MDO6406600.1 sugar dehydrogenase complex small subunit [Pantoea phytobeneficialis]QGR09691.1 dehydrogenase [Pantoea phytobeneficialis]
MSMSTDVSPAGRRRFIKLLATTTVLGATSSLLPGQMAWAIDAGMRSNPVFTAFMTVSEIICGYPELDNALGQRIFTLMQSRNAELKNQLVTLNKILNADMRSVDMQKALQGVDQNTQTLFTDILRAWQLGIVGSGKEAKVVAYEYALMYTPIADVVVLPTYARGEPHYWAKPPVIKSL